MKARYKLNDGPTLVVGPLLYHTPERRFSATDPSLSMCSTDSNGSLSFSSSPVTPSSQSRLTLDQTPWSVSGFPYFTDSPPIAHYKKDLALISPQLGPFIPGTYGRQYCMPASSSPTMPGADIEGRPPASLLSPQTPTLWTDESPLPVSRTLSFCKTDTTDYIVPSMTLGEPFESDCSPTAGHTSIASSFSMWPDSSGISLPTVAPDQSVGLHMESSISPLQLTSPTPHLITSSPERHPPDTPETAKVKTRKIAKRKERRQRRLKVDNQSLTTVSRGKFSCTMPNCGQTFGRLEHNIRHRKSHEDASPFRCVLTEFLGPDSCNRRCKRADNRDQHHHTHGKSGLCDRGPRGRNVLVEPEVLIQALKKTSFCDDQECNLRGPCTSSLHLETMGSKRQGRVDAQLTRYIKNAHEAPSKKRRSKGIASMHVPHEQMRKLGFPECLSELQELCMRPGKSSSRIGKSIPPGYRYFSYQQKCYLDGSGQSQDWRIDHNGCIFVREIGDDGCIGERSLCGSLHHTDQGQGHITFFDTASSP